MPTSVSLDELKREAILDSDITFGDFPLDSIQSPRAIFLTGATGFLGAYLLRDLLTSTEAILYCLVRASDDQAAITRLQAHLTNFGLWQEGFKSRIITVVGDLSQPQLGLNQTELNDLSHKIDVIYHNGAQVNAMYTYQKLKAVNVEGTKEILRLARLVKAKPIHFVSTLAVFFSDQYKQSKVKESEFAALDEGLKGGYKQSKWVAEQLMRQARERGLPVSIYRPGRIMGDSQSGSIDRLSDLLGNLLQACLQIESYPIVDTWINFAPVDAVSRSIVDLSLNTAAQSQNFHLNHPKSIQWNELWHIIQSLGYVVEGVSYEEWVSRINQAAKTKEDKKLFIIVRHLLKSPIYLFQKKPNVLTQETQMHIHPKFPDIDENLIRTYLDYFRQSGHIPSPY